ncbi:MAG: 50S ribosomal protein L21 [Parcubacteria group bacterium GW2011_GWC2_39_14]|nr:MAG: 50S ribosomal protein L21 [Parcubacteria group bacterium GW2011_GWC2_39_14]KKR54534.1 MAG: 50S ribosomal protein L21 [Parcubacteria group bacterium GW2011_GWA2_40_23]
MTIAIIKTGGKQYKVSEGTSLKVEKLAGEVGETLKFEEVLLVTDEQGDKIELGQPFVKGAVVEGKILEQGRADKVDVIKYRPKTRYRRKAGHRQMFTKVEITKV